MIRDITARKRVARRAIDLDGWQDTIIDSLVDGVMVVDDGGVIVRINEAFELLFGTQRRWIAGHRLEDMYDLALSFGIELIDSDGRAVAAADHPLMQSLATGRRLTGVTHEIRKARAPSLWVRVTSQAIVDEHLGITGAVASFSDVTEGRRASLELRREEQFLQVLLENLDEGIVGCDADGRMTVFNQGAKRLHGIPDDADPVGKIPTHRGILHVDGSPLEPGENPLVRAMSGERVRDVELVLESRSGDRRLVSVNGQTLIDEHGMKLGAVVAMRDVTEQKRNEERLADLALRDPLTGLANRTLLGERLQQAIKGAIRPIQGDRGRPRGSSSATTPGVAVFLLDLDDFKEVNDVCGHDVGDDVLVAVSERLLSIVRPTDTVARLGGDEFVVVCEVEEGQREIAAITERISSVLSEPHQIDGRHLTVSASVGGVMVDDSSSDVSQWLSKADDSMYNVKWSRRLERRSMFH